MPAVFAPTEISDLATRRRNAAHEWVELGQTIPRISAATKAPTPPWYRVPALIRHVRARRAAEARYPDLLRSYRSILRDLEDLAVGAGSRWGVFSTARSEGTYSPDISLEQTLERLQRAPGVDAEVIAAARRTLDTLPAMRVLTELGQDADALRRTENAVLALAESPSVDRDGRRHLLEHIPAERRPEPSTAEDLQRSRPVKLWVSEEAAIPELGQIGWITLHDIVTPGAQGHGLGTEALLELCRYADSVGKPIEGELIPSYGASTDDLHRLAGWYHRAGFRQDDVDPDHWTIGSRIHRPPNPSKTR